MDDEELLNYLYHTKKNYGGVEQLYTKAKIRHPKISKAFVKEWLSNQKGYQLNIIKKSWYKILSSYILRNALGCPN
jgi:hypothetical protein